jgi:hypothetical protein
VTALWQCAVCETINQGSRSCTACGASLTRRSAAATAVRSRLVPLPPPPRLPHRSLNRSAGRSSANRSTKWSGLTTRPASTGCPGRRRDTAPVAGSDSGDLCLTTRPAPVEVPRSRSAVAVAACPSRCWLYWARAGRCGAGCVDMTLHPRLWPRTAPQTPRQRRRPVRRTRTAPTRLGVGLRPVPQHCRVSCQNDRTVPVRLAECDLLAPWAQRPAPVVVGSSYTVQLGTGRHASACLLAEKCAHMTSSAAGSDGGRYSPQRHGAARQERRLDRDPGLAAGVLPGLEH